jgi:GNAT superfamily N-acetyltransferase
MLQITHATTPVELETVRMLFREYEAQIGGGSQSADFDAELAGLPGPYAAPAGRLLIAIDGSGPVGCGGIAPHGQTGCELKRLYVRPSARGQGVARRLATTAIETARAIGYRQMLIETLPSMVQAHALYRSLGFQHERRAPARTGWSSADTDTPAHFWLDLSGPGIR